MNGHQDRAGVISKKARRPYRHASPTSLPSRRKGRSRASPSQSKKPLNRVHALHPHLLPPGVVVSHRSDLPLPRARTKRAGGLFLTLQDRRYALFAQFDEQFAPAFQFPSGSHPAPVGTPRATKANAPAHVNEPRNLSDFRSNRFADGGLHGRVCGLPSCLMAIITKPSAAMGCSRHRRLSAGELRIHHASSIRS